MNMRPPRPDDAREFYESISELYPTGDKWHRATHEWLRRFIHKHFRGLTLNDRSVLNVGSGGESFGIPERAIVHVDLHRNGFTPDQELILGDITQLQPLGGAFSSCICVGSVINHCDGAAAITTIGRELRPGGTLYLEFESSYSLEFVGKPPFRQSATVVETAYQGRSMRLWVYAPQYIHGLLKAIGFEVRTAHGKHYLSPLVFRLGASANAAAACHGVDVVARHVPLLRRHAHNVIFVCRKL